MWKGDLVCGMILNEKMPSEESGGYASKDPEQEKFVHGLVSTVEMPLVASFMRRA